MPISKPSAAKPSLLRQLGVVSATALVVSNMIGTGIFTTSGFLAGDLGSPKLVLWIWVVGAVVALCGAFCYSELGINMPSSGGEYVYLTQAFGPTWGFMTGWISFFAGFSAPIAAGALAFADYLGHFYPGLHQEHSRALLGSGEWTLSFGWAQLVACALVLLFTIINIFGVLRVARLQNVLTGAKVLILCAFIALAFAGGQGEWANFSMNATRTATTSLTAQFAISLFWIYFAYSGWNAATYVAEELRQPARTLPLALTAGTLLVGTLYLALNVVFIYAAPLETMKGEVAVGALAASRLFGPRVADMFSALLALSLMSMVNAMVTIGPRVYYAMAKNKAFLSAAAKVHPKWHTPVAAIVAQGVCTMLLTMTPFPQLVVYIGFTLNFFAVMSVASLLLFRRRAGWQKLRVVSFAYPLIPVIFLVVGIWMTVMGLQLKPWISLATIVTVATGALVYHFGLRARARQETAPTIETY
ncbi:MAG TPA: amino acid permease [Bryobacteraceae bacterium]|nr:amino acid permease [Bryobacteraceae bacterium]